jgi:hypothetical protein
MNFFKACAVTLALFLIACVNHLAVNGTGTDAGEAKVTGAVHLPGNIPGSNIAVALRNQNYLPFSIPVQDQKRTATDNVGTFTLNQVSSGYYLIELWNNDTLGAIKRFYVHPNSGTVDLGTIGLDALADYSGKVLDNGTPASNSFLLVLGMDKRMAVRADGSFSISLPRGQQIFKIEQDTGLLSREFMFSAENSGDTLSLNTPASTVFEDFNRIDSCNNLNPLLVGGWWWAFSDTGYGGRSLVLPTMDPGLMNAIDSTASAYSGGSLHVTFQLDSLYSAPYALIGSDIGASRIDTSGAAGRSWFDMRKTTAITFMAKGSGTIYLQLTSRYLTGSGKYEFPFEIPFDLTSSWKKYSISTSAIPNAAIPNMAIIVPWSTGAGMINNIAFLAKKSAELWLDDIVIEGMNPADFLQNY